MFQDISNLYKSFLHFNLSKIIIFIAAILYAIIGALPFVIVLGSIYYYVVET
jgi:hypothetical protein